MVSGGVECEAGDPSLKDRLYLNEMMGIFVRAPIDAIPDYRDSGSAAAAADSDHDGDLDLFVGGRSIPGRYPLTPKSHLLRNEGGRFLVWRRLHRRSAQPLPIWMATAIWISIWFRTFLSRNRKRAGSMEA